MVITIRSRLENRITFLKALLSSTDYKTLKYMEGRLTEEEFTAIKAQRQAWRDEIGRLENLTDEQARAEGLIFDIDTPEPVAEEPLEEAAENEE